MLDAMKSFGSFLGYTVTKRNYNALKIGAACMISLVEKGSLLALPLVAEYIYESQASETSAISPYGYVASFAVVWGFGRLWPTLRRLAVNNVRADVQAHLTVEMVKKCYELELNHQVTQPKGEFAHAFAQTYSSIDRLIPSFFSEVAPMLIEVIGVSAILGMRYGVIGISELGVLFAYAIPTAIGNKLSKTTQKERLEKGKEVYAGTFATIQRYKIAKQFGREDHEIKEIEALLGQYSKLTKKTYRREDLSSFFQSLVSLSGFVGITMLTAFKTVHEEYKLIDIAIILYYYTQFTLQLDAFSTSLSNLINALMEVDSVVKFLNKPPQVKDRDDAVDLHIGAPPKITFNHLSFSYDNDHEVLTDVTFDINPGEFVAIVGESGIGKSTLLKLLQRFYQTEHDSIRINDVPIDDYKSASVRQYFSIVAQKVELFNETLRENIRYGRMDATDEQVKEALCKAGLAELADDEVLNKRIGEEGAKLSGGQIQRVAIARAILKEAQVLLLDEPLKGLDANTARNVRRTLDTLAKNKTTLYISHDLKEMLLRADKLVYVDLGRCYVNNFEQLLQQPRSFLYSDLLTEENLNQWGYATIEEFLQARQETRQEIASYDAIQLEHRLQDVIEIEDGDALDRQYNERTHLLINDF